MARLSSSGGRLNIMVEDVTNEYDVQELQTAAIVHLIESSPTEFWERDAIEAGDEEDISGKFYEAVLTAVACHRAVDDDRLVGKPIYEALYQLIEELCAIGRLQEPTVGVIPDEGNE